MTEKNIVFQDIFEVQKVDPDGKRFDKVSRFECRSELYEMNLVFDVNVDIYPLTANDKFTLALATSLSLDGTLDSGKYDASMQSGKPSLMDKYEYVMYGKIFKFKDTNQLVEVYISFGGLLMKLSGDPKKLEDLELDANIYLLIRKV